MAKMNKKGRSASERFKALPDFMINSVAWRSLSPQDRAVWVEIARIYNGGNNGHLARSVRQLSELANINKDTAARCLKTLVQRGFIECAQQGGFSRKTPHAAEWRLTHRRCDRTGALPTKEFQKWRPSVDCGPEQGRAQSGIRGQKKLPALRLVRK